MDWSQIDQLILNKAMCAGQDSKARQIKKFTRLHKKQHPITKNEKETVINLSDKKLDEAVSSLLQKGLNFEVKPRSTPIEDILTGMEKAILSLPVEKAEEARQESVRILKNRRHLHCRNTWKMCEFQCAVQPHNTVTYV